MALALGKNSFIALPDNEGHSGLILSKTVWQDLGDFVRSFIGIYRYISASLVAQRLKRLPAMRETWVWSLSLEDPLEKEMAAHSSILAWRIPWTEEPGRLQSMGSQRVRHN